MKKILLILIMLVSTTVMAEHFHGVRCCNHPQYATDEPFAPLVYAAKSVWYLITHIRIY